MGFLLVIFLERFTIERPCRYSFAFDYEIDSYRPEFLFFTKLIEAKSPDKLKRGLKQGCMIHYDQPFIKFFLSHKHFRSWFKQSCSSFLVQHMPAESIFLWWQINTVKWKKNVFNFTTVLWPTFVVERKLVLIKTKKRLKDLVSELLFLFGRSIIFLYHCNIDLYGTEAPTMRSHADKVLYFATVWCSFMASPPIL